jgi:hypothetical protein
LNAGVLTSIDVSTTCAAMVLQEAASLKIMPSFDYTSVRPITINAETMPAFAAEVCYFLHLFLLTHVFSFCSPTMSAHVFY